MEFKNVYDALVGRLAAVQDVATRIEDLFAADNQAGALALEPELDAAQLACDRMQAIYEKLTNVSTDAPQQNFVPASEPSPAADAITRPAFDQLSTAEKGVYLAKGGKIEDEDK